MERLVGWAYAMRGMQRFKILVEGHQGRKISRTLGIFFPASRAAKRPLAKLGGFERGSYIPTADIAGEGYLTGRLLLQGSTGNESSFQS